jgi:hypothetical protein
MGVITYGVGTVLGLVLALRTLRSAWVVWASLALGILVPVLCLWLGQRH